ncbi:MAG: hypothetical protein AUJ98_00525 [Bacteroidetes bacterium CG2_30_33_31]|nr:MAG: hypothetical protein AUJ98_00525 [Bacteroidetes bacterium CG2_30_33_31]
MKILLLFIASLLPYLIFSQTVRRVLFLGNSYTFVNDLPQLTANFSQAAGDSLIFDSNTPGGYSLQQHSVNQTTLTKIALGNWDFVVLQEQSQMPSFPLSQVLVEVFPYAKKLDSLIKAANPCTQTIFFMTWGRKNGDSYNCSSWPPVCTYLGMDSLLNLRYRIMADSNSAFVALVGATWHYLRDNYPSIELYDTDQSHPSAAGSYAAATTFYSIIFQKNPQLVHYDYSLNNANAQIIRNAAKLIAFDSLSKWNVGKYIPQSNFNYNVSNDTVYFNNSSIYASNYLWNFGDGDTSTAISPMHVYSTNALFKVKLISKKCGLMDSISKSINIVNSSIRENANSNFFTLYPNPTKDFFVIKSNKIIYKDDIEITIFDNMGREIYHNEAYKVEERIFTKEFLKGNYFVIIKSKSTIYHTRISVI